MEIKCIMFDFCLKCFVRVEFKIFIYLFIQFQIIYVNKSGGPRTIRSGQETQFLSFNLYDPSCCPGVIVLEVWWVGSFICNVDTLLWKLVPGTLLHRTKAEVFFPSKYSSPGTF